MNEISKKERRQEELNKHAKKLSEQELQNEKAMKAEMSRLYKRDMLNAFCFLIIPIFLLGWFGYWITSPDSKEEISECRTEIVKFQKEYKAYAKYSNSSSLVSRTKAKIYNEIKIDVAAIDDYLRTGKVNSNYTPKVNFLDGCSLEYYEEQAPILIKEAKAEEARLEYEALPESVKEDMKLSPEQRRAKVEAEMAQEYSKIDNQDKVSFENAKKRATGLPRI